MPLLFKVALLLRDCDCVVLLGTMAEPETQLDPKVSSGTSEGPCVYLLWTQLLPGVSPTSLGQRTEDQLNNNSCSQCRRTFPQRHVMETNTMLAALLQALEETGLQAAPTAHCCAETGNVSCDVCSGKKQKALESCMVCRASYCAFHLQPLLKSPASLRHKLVEPT